MFFLCLDYVISFISKSIIWKLCTILELIMFD